MKCQTRSNQSRDWKITIDNLNKFFISIGPELSRQVLKPHHTIDLPCFDKSMVLNDTSPEEIALIIEKMKNEKNSGSDVISNEILICCSPVVEEHLSKASNDCLKIGTFQNALKLQRLWRSSKKMITWILKSTARLVY